MARLASSGVGQMVGGIGAVRMVTKFGGSSCGSVAAYNHLANYFAGELAKGNQVVGVFSAMFAVTDRLLAAVASAEAGDTEGVVKARKAVWDLHEQTLHGLVTDEAKRNVRLDWMQQRMETYFDATTQRVGAAGACTAFDMDQIASMGERLSIGMMHALCEERGIPAALVESDTLLVTSDESGNATPLLKETRVNVVRDLLPLLEDGQVPLVSGFFGTSATSGKLTTLGRGGTDLTAAVLGHALDADEINLYKVEYTKTPEGWLDEWQPGWIGVVHDAEPDETIPTMSYRDAAQLAHFGKKVLHPSTVHPAVEKQIPIFVKNNVDPDHAGTQICHTRGSADYPVTSVCSLSVAKYKSMHATLDEEQLLMPVRETTSRESCRTLLPDALLQQTIDRLVRLQRDGLRRMGMKKTGELHETLETVTASIAERMADVTTMAQDLNPEQIAFVSVVGHGIAKVPALRDTLLRVLEANNIACTVPDQVNGSDDNFTVVVWKEQEKLAKTLLHTAFVGKKYRRMDAPGAGQFWTKQRQVALGGGSSHF